MKKTVWDFFAPIYEASMKSQKNIYDYLYQNISRAAEGKTVLELATGPGMIAKHIASAAKTVVATDFAPNMIETAKKGCVPQNVTFEVADATSLPYADKAFDLVVIANALHIIPDPQKALAQIKRVLKDGGLLIAPNFI
ncbi:MAG: class I SAM-dependent methyltransferase, partial [Treponema sp.]|nr:class I SAM-dependent methyltransferase [Treponema sp.]